MSETQVFGVDEAGRGPVFGSMFIACVSAPESDLPSDVADSKTVSDKKRNRLYREIQDAVSVRATIIEVTPDEIDSTEEGITRLTATRMAAAIESTVVADEEGYVDACHPDEDVFEELVKDGFKTRATIEISAEHKADESHPIVSAASILAKESRENHVEGLSDEWGAIGSGYPSDPTTRSYLSEYVQEHGVAPPFARKSWNTVEDALNGDL